MKRGLLVVAVLATLLAALPAMAQGPSRPPVPRAEIVDTIRGMAAQTLHVKKSDVNVHGSLAASGMTESQLNELVVDIGQEFGVVISARAIFEAKQAEPVQPLSVLRLADMVDDRMRRPSFPD